MNRIETRFSQLRARGEKGFVAYIGAGDPDLQATLELALGMGEAGVDILELGIPFSDPLADGLVNQLAAQRGLASGTTPRMVLQTVSLIRRQSEIPIVLYVYYNLLHRLGLETFIEEAAQSGVDGLLVLDLPPEESGNYEALMKKRKLSTIYLVAPTTPEERIQLIVAHGSGFIYYVSREGVTGKQKAVSETIAEMIARIRKCSELPIAVGFGISSPEQARAVAAHADAIVVGSAIVDEIARVGKKAKLVPAVCRLVRSLVMAAKTPLPGVPAGSR